MIAIGRRTAGHLAAQKYVCVWETVRTQGKPKKEKALWTREREHAWCVRMQRTGITSRGRSVVGDRVRRGEGEEGMRGGGDACLGFGWRSRVQEREREECQPGKDD